MTPRDAVIELERAIAQAIVRYEQAVPSGICVGIFINRYADGFKVKSRLKTKPSTRTSNLNPQPASIQTKKGNA